MKNIKRYSTVAEYNADQTRDLPCVSYIAETDKVVFDKQYKDRYLAFIPKSRAMSFRFSGNTSYYSLDEGQSWTLLPSNTASPSVNVGKKIMWKGNMTVNGNNGIGVFSSPSGALAFDVEGNIMSLINGDNFATATTLSDNYIFKEIFKRSGVANAEHLVLPAKTLAQGCYQSMFNACTSLTTAPSVLPATTLATSCYSSMFNGCTALTTAPALPATTLAESCYQYMFYNCTSLTGAPELPATTLANYCYESMFFNCSGMTKAPELLATTLVNSCYQNMFNACSNLNSITCLATSITGTASWLSGVAASGTFIKDANATWTTGASGIPDGWTVQNYGS